MDKRIFIFFIALIIAGLNMPAMGAEEQEEKMMFPFLWLICFSVTHTLT